jgi:predicted protein tyrosine phosphatase
MTPTIAICGYQDVPGHAHLPFTHIISIGHVEDCPDIRPFRQRDFTMHRFVFEDISGPGDTSPTLRIMKRMIDTFATIRDTRTFPHVLFHCAAGRSRSTAAAFIFLIVAGWSYEDAYREIVRVRGVVQPNLWMIKLADHILGHGGKMVTFVANASGHADWLDQPHHQVTL